MHHTSHDHTFTSKHKIKTRQTFFFSTLQHPKHFLLSHPLFFFVIFFLSSSSFPLGHGEIKAFCAFQAHDG
jgi:hypothetical protein